MENDPAVVSQLHFLVADEDAFQRRWLVAMLTNLGAHQVSEAEDGQQALELLQAPNSTVDIALFDVRMPRVDGLQLLRELAASGTSVSVILVSSLDPAVLFSVAATARAHGIEMLGTIAKPAVPEALSACLKQFRPAILRSATVRTGSRITPADVQIALDQADFVPLFQPKVALADGAVQGVEAFARWHHAEHGWIAPAVFIAALEASGQMEQLTWIMLDKSIQAQARWKQQELELPISINLSPSTLARAGFAEQVHRYVEQRGIAPADFIFEVTESATVGNLPTFLENLTRLRMQGFGLAVDDFGTGQAGLQELLRIPFSEMKIDRSFVAGASQNPALEIVLSSSLALCQKLERKSVAVGVESQQDWDFLRKLGCHFAQGYHIARPMDGAAIPAWMEDWSQYF